ncbi:neutral zinc metallopeptidase [Ornithinimicrobium pratense]|uniref:Neutral zinc metallopeptidase n=1 Tax=Ornithinimicrobium pratense TaxID=2593973 RepID=A0A5J6V6H3_9MICO|nr:neutral zinc metallopeptidase [Ornithinimicrobium pratense]QFG68726.1 neutral zinc metallopeptidase [Ornithinimicrobium pratense]
MTFRENANISGGRTRRGGGGGRGGGGRGGGGMVVGGGAGALLLALVVLLFGGDPEDVLGGGQQPAPITAQDRDLAQCRSGADANAFVECRMKGGMASLENYWSQTYPQAPPATAILFTGQVNTGCGAASSAVGPFYCPLDRQIYLDTTFFNQLQGQLGAQGGSLGELYVLGHEYAHHIQNYTGVLQASQQSSTGPESGAVRVELQADCLSGVWLGEVSRGQDTLLEPPTEEQIRSALSAAAAVGDDSIQERAQGQVTPHTWTHGSSEQRMGWFMRGYRSADPGQCDVLNAGSVEEH